MSKKETEHDTLVNRMKSYEELSTPRHLMPNCPIYARIDGRAFHIGKLAEERIQSEQKTRAKERGAK